MEQELLTLPDNMSSSPVLVGFMLFDLCFLCNVLEIIVFPFVLFLLTIELSILLDLRPANNVCQNSRRKFKEDNRNSKIQLQLLYQK